MTVGHTENIAKIVLSLNLDPEQFHHHPLYASQFIFELHHKANKDVMWAVTDKQDFYVVAKYDDQVVEIDPKGSGCTTAIEGVKGGCQFDEFITFINTRIWTKTSLQDYCFQDQTQEDFTFSNQEEDIDFEQAARDAFPWVAASLLIYFVGSKMFKRQNQPAYVPVAAQ